MGSTRWRKVLRDVWLHKSRTILVVLAIAVGMLGAGSVLDTWSLIRQVTRSEFRDSNPASATLRTDSVDDALLARVRVLPTVAQADARRTVIGSVRTQSGWRTAMLFAVDDFSAIPIGTVRLERGAWPANGSALAVESSSVEFAGTAVGESLSVQVGDATPIELNVTGIARDVGLAPGWMDHVVYGFATRQALARLGVPSSLNELRIVVRDRSLDREAVRRIAYEVKALVERTGRRVTDVNVPVPGRHVHAAQIESLLYTQGAFGILALLMSGVLVINLIAAMLAGQVREIGVMKAVGAQGGQIAGMYLGLALVLGCVAATVALPAAAIVGRQYAQFTADLLNFDISGASIGLRVIAAQLAVGLLLPVAAAWVPVSRGCRITVSDALRDFGLASNRGSVVGRRLGRVTGATRPFLLALRNAVRRPRRMALTLMTLAAGGAVYLGALNLRASISRSVDLLFRAQHFDIAVRFARTLPAERVEKALASVLGVARAEAWSGGRAAVARPGGIMGNTFQIVGPPVPSAMLTPVAEQGRWLDASDDGALVVNRRLLEDEPSLAVGAGVTLIIAGRPRLWRVVGVVEAGLNPMAYAPRAALARLVGDGGVSGAVVAATARGREAQLELIQRLRDAFSQNGLPVQSAELLADTRAAAEDHLLMVAGFLGIMAQVMIVVGGLGLAATMSIAVLERTREIGVLRAIGARHGAIFAQIQIEGLVIALASWAIAIPLSVPMSVVLGRAFGRVMFRVPVTLMPEAPGVVRWLALVLVVSVVACAWPAVRAMRITTAAALAYD